jgi:MFS family permease
MSFVQLTGVSVAADTMMPVLKLTQVDIGLLNTAFLITYTFMQIPGGALGQYFGARRSYVAVGVLGLLATVATPALSRILTGLRLFVGLLIAQLILGISLAPIFPVFAWVGAWHFHLPPFRSHW